MATREQTQLVLDPKECDAVVFDMDGVLTDTAPVHAAAWKSTFDDYLSSLGSGSGRVQPPFDAEEDYRRHVDGKPRADGVRDFLASRDLEVPEGQPGDPAERETVHGIGKRKNARFLEALRRDGVSAFDDAVELLRRLRRAGIPTALISASRNAGEVLDRSGIADLLDVRVDGAEAAEADLAGKPAPDTLLEAVQRLGASPERCAVFEDARAGVEAGRRAGFGWVVGVARRGAEEAAALRAAGAGFAVSALEQVDVHLGGPEQRAIDELPAVEDEMDAILERIGAREAVLLLDFDGTLTPIVDRPDEAVLGPKLRKRILELGARHTIAIVSGRDLADLRERVGIDDLYYAGSHGFELSGPGGWQHEAEDARRFLPALDEAEEQLRSRVRGLAGVEIERKRYGIAVHFRRADDDVAERAREAATQVASGSQDLRTGEGRAVVEVRPALDWHKGRAVELLLRELDLDADRYCPIYVGDDVTDEDAFAAVEDAGVAIVVRGRSGETRARYALDDPTALASFLARLDDEEARRA